MIQTTRITFEVNQNAILICEIYHWMFDQGWLKFVSNDERSRITILNNSSDENDEDSATIECLIHDDVGDALITFINEPEKAMLFKLVWME